MFILFSNNASRKAVTHLVQVVVKNYGELCVRVFVCMFVFAHVCVWA